MLRILTINSKLVCSHGAGEVQLGPGADWFQVQGAPALRVLDVLNRPIQNCPYCKSVVTVQYGDEDSLSIENETGRTQILTELAFGTTNAGAWRVAHTSSNGVQIAFAGETVPVAPRVRSTRAISKDTPALIPEMSGPLVFLEWQVYRCPKSEPSSFEPDHSPVAADGHSLNAIESLLHKWLYVYTVDGRKRRHFFKEYWITDSGLAQEVKSGPRATATPSAPTLDTARYLQLPLEKGARPRRYAFLASRRRIPAPSIHKCAKCPEIPEQDVGPMPTTVNAVDALTVADHMSRTYTKSRERFLTEAAGLTPDGTAISENGQKMLLAGLLQGLLDNEELEKDLNLKEELYVDRIAKVVTNHDKHLESLQIKSEEAAEQLIRWLQGPLWAQTVEAYTMYPSLDFEVLLPVFSRCMDRLLETAPTREYGLALLKDKRHFVHEFVSRTKTTVSDIVQIARKTPEVIVPIWQLGMLWAQTPHFEPTAYVRSLFLVLADEEVEIAIGSIQLTIWRTKAFAVSSSYIDMIEVPNRLKYAMRGITDSETIGTLVDRYKGVFEALNLGIAISNIRKDGRLENYVELIGAAVDALKEVGDQVGWKHKIWRHVTGKQLLAGLGMSSAICDIVGGIGEFRKARANNDPHAAAGWMTYTVGNALLFVAETGRMLSAARVGWLVQLRAVVIRLAVSGVRLATSVRIGASVVRLAGPIVARTSRNLWTLIGAALVVVGILIVAIWKKKALQKLAFNCEWGKAEDRDNDRPIWSVEPFDKWPGHFEVQLRSLCNLLAAFRVSAADDNVLCVQPGLTMGSTRINIVARYTNSAGGQCVRGISHVWEKLRDEPLSGWKTDDSIATSWRARGPRESIIEELLVTFRGAAEETDWLGMKSYRRVTTWIRFDMIGDKSLCVPGARPWIKYDLYETAVLESGHVEAFPIAIIIPNTAEVTSLDIDCLADGPLPPSTTP